jgi:hypothetical protein
MSHVHWSMYEELIGLGVPASELLASARAEHAREPSHDLSEWMAGVVVFMAENARDVQRNIDDFERFCAAQPRTPQGMRAIEEEAARLKAAHQMIWSSGSDRA